MTPTRPRRASFSRAQLGCILAIVAVSLVALTGCARRHKSKEKRGVYDPPKNALEAAYKTRGSASTVKDPKGLTTLRLRTRHNGYKLFGEGARALGYASRTPEGTLLLQDLKHHPLFLVSEEKGSITVRPHTNLEKKPGSPLWTAVKSPSSWVFKNAKGKTVLSASVAQSEEGKVWSFQSSGESLKALEKQGPGLRTVRLEGPDGKTRATLHSRHMAASALAVAATEGMEPVVKAGLMAYLNWPQNIAAKAPGVTREPAAETRN